MRLFDSPTSPYARKVNVVAIELGLSERIERQPSSASPVKPNAELSAQNPLGKVPTLITDDGRALYDSRVICEYLASLVPGSAVFPAAGEARFLALQQQALGDGMLDAALLARYETSLRPEPLRWDDWAAGQLNKIRQGVDQIEAQAGTLGSRVDIGTLALACALGYLDLRYADLNWRAGHPRAAAWYESFAQRPSLRETQPKS